jgi:cell division protein FtsB
MEFLPLFGLSTFILIIVTFFQGVHKETLEQEIVDLKKELKEEAAKNRMLAKLNDDLNSEIKNELLRALPRLPLESNQLMRRQSGY